jgi:hypothetical protein
MADVVVACADDLAGHDVGPRQGRAGAALELRGGVASRPAARPVGIDRLGVGVQVQRVGLGHQRHRDAHVLPVDLVHAGHQRRLGRQDLGVAAAEEVCVGPVVDQREPECAQGHRLARARPQGGARHVGHELLGRRVVLVQGVAVRQVLAREGYVRGGIVAVARLDVARPVAAADGRERTLGRDHQAQARRRVVDADPDVVPDLRMLGRQLGRQRGAARDLEAGEAPVRLGDRQDHE